MKRKRKSSGLESENMSTRYGKDRKRMKNKLGVNKKELTTVLLNKRIKTLPMVNDRQHIFKLF